MSRGRHSAPPEHHVARAVVGSTAAVGLGTGGMLAVTPTQAQTDAMVVQPDTRPMQRLQVAATEPAAVSSPVAQTVVRQGDTLSRIGASIGEPWRTLYADNQQTIGSNPNLIQPGQRLSLSPGPVTAPIPVATPVTTTTTRPAPAPVATSGRHRAVTDGEDVVAQARKYLGVPYAWGGSSGTGLDCSGLVLRVFADLGVAQLPHSAQAQSNIGTRVTSLAQAEPGDLLFFVEGGRVGHVAVYIGDGQMIAAPDFGDHVKVQPVYTTPSVIRRLV